MAAIGRPQLKLVVVGGESGLVGQYQEKVRQMGLERQVRFVGMQKDVRPYLWLSDAFVFPSSYETFSLVSFQAAAAGILPIVSRFHGVDELVVDGVNSLVVACTVDAVRHGIERFLEMSPHERRAMGERAQQDVNPFSAEHFDASWRALYEAQKDATALGPADPDPHRGV